MLVERINVLHMQFVLDVKNVEILALFVYMFKQICGF